MQKAELQQKIVTFIQSDLKRRCTTNPNYSLRAYARSLGVDCSYLSKIINKKRSVSPKVLNKIVTRLSLPEDLLEYIPKEREDEFFTSIEIDKFKFISDWYHYAILELTNHKKFVPTASFISSELGISEAEAFEGMERLKRVGLLTSEHDSSGRETWKIKNNSTVQHKYSHVAFRHLQKQILTQALFALETTPIELRDQSSITMLINPKKVLAAKEKIKKFRRQLMNYLEKGSGRSTVYQLSVSLFPPGSPNRQESR